MSGNLSSRRGKPECVVFEILIQVRESYFAALSHLWVQKSSREQILWEVRLWIGRGDRTVSSATTQSANVHAEIPRGQDPCDWR
jgi:hypothetical protein